MLLIDTYNLLHAGIASGGPFSGLTVRQLCQWIVSSPGPPENHPSRCMEDVLKLLMFHAPAV